MKGLKTRQFAWVVTIFLMLFSIMFSGSRSLRKLRAEVEQTYENGITNDGYSIQSHLNDRVDITTNLITVASRVIPGDKTVEDVSAAKDQLIAAKTPGEQYKANTNLTEAATALYEKLGSVEMNERDKDYRQSLYVDLASDNVVIDFLSEDYNLTAAEFNKDLNRFPANLIRIITNIKIAELYG